MNRAAKSGAALLLMSALLVPGAVFAEETMAPLQLGPVIVHPALSLRETYDDNIFSTAKDTKSDFITSVAPSVLFKLPFRTHEFSFGASAEFNQYADHTDLNTSPFEVYGLADFSIGDRVKLKVGNTYLDGEESPLDSPNGTLDDYTSNQAAISAKYTFVDVAQVQMDYTRTMLDYLDSNYRTRDEDFVSLYLYYRVLPNTSAFLEYDFKNVAYDKTNALDLDNIVNSALVGATWEISDLSKGTAKIGFLSKNYSDGKVKDVSTWTASVDLSHQISDVASVRLLAKRDVNEGKQLGVRSFTTTGFYTDFTYRFVDRLSGVVDASYGVDTFSNNADGSAKVREDKTARIGFGVKYMFNSWLNCSAGYSYSNRDSNIAGSDAVTNRVNFAVTAFL